MAVPSIPYWLTVDFLKSCLESDGENFRDITVTSHTIEAAVPPGNNYGSHMFRTKILYKKPHNLSTEQSISLIIKAPLTDDSFLAKQIGDNTKFYEAEPKYYNEFITETYKLCKHSIVPKHYKSPNPLCVVLEDLKTSGFEMVDRRKLLDFDHCKLFTEASSKLHALAMAMYNNNPELIEKLAIDNAAMADKSEKIDKLLIPNNLVCMAAYLEDKPDYKKQFNIIKEASENDTFWHIYQEMEESSKTKPLKALTQRDPWCANMMFQYNSSGKVTGIKILDFQNVKLTSPIVEFVLFLTACANLEVRQNRLNDLYQIYIDSLNKNLEELGCLVKLSLEELKEEIISLSPITFSFVCGLPLAIATDLGDLTEYTTVRLSIETVKESSFYKSVYQGYYFDMMFPKILDVYDKHGIFDYMSYKIKTIKSAKS